MGVMYRLPHQPERHTALDALCDYCDKPIRVSYSQPVRAGSWHPDKSLKRQGTYCAECWHTHIVPTGLFLQVGEPDIPQEIPA